MPDHFVKVLGKSHIPDLLFLAKQLHPHLAIEELQSSFEQMFELPQYTCYGLFVEGKIEGISSAWFTIKLYSGPQLEVDNVIINRELQSKGYGKILLEAVESHAVAIGCKTLELNAYVGNTRSHKFYYNLGYKILGFHFQKKLKSK